MPVIPEGSLVFNFPDADDWHAFKYDEKDPAKPSFYRERIEKIKSMKGVDIVAGIRPDFYDLILIEIKDFRNDAPGLREKIRTKEIPLEILQKTLNTWAALSLGARNEDALLAPDLRAAIRRSPERLKLVFFLAQTRIQQSPQERDTQQKMQNRRVQRQDLLKKMREKLKPLGIQCDLADFDDLPPRCGWVVTDQLVD
ncbi:hypothetical protein [Hymenobacter terrenus]|uniref:hypothetical protein n=1 Tax=Hymenobacter terrenus TaxID=1629124 RepID=UPI000619DB3D|nr:hypothetical protein [Hymenobacter terrenus]